MAPMKLEPPCRLADERSDQDLLRATRRGQSEAFGAFYDRHVEAVTLYFLRRTYSSIEADDLAEETFAQALRSLSRYRKRLGEPRGWLFGIAQNLLRDWYRSGHARTEARARLGMQRALVGDDFERVEDAVDLEVLTASLPAALLTLSPALREAVLLRVSEQRPYEEVAEALGCTIGAARVRVNRALAHLNEEMAERL